MKQLKKCTEPTCTHSIIRNDGIGSRQGLMDQRLYFSLSLTGLACSTARRQYSTWNEQVERDQSSLFSSSSSNCILLLPTQQLPHRSDCGLLFEALCCKCWTLRSRGNSQYGSARGPCNAFEDLQERSIDNFTGAAQMYGFYYYCSMAGALSTADFQFETTWNIGDANKQLLGFHDNNGKSILFCLRTLKP